MPLLRGVIAGRVLAGLRLHEDAVAVDERNLVVHQQVAVVQRLLLRNERVVDHVGDDAIQVLAGDGNESGVLRIRRPLRPEWGGPRGLQRGRRREEKDSRDERENEPSQPTPSGHRASHETRRSMPRPSRRRARRIRPPDEDAHVTPVGRVASSAGRGGVG